MADVGLVRDRRMCATFNHVRQSPDSTKVSLRKYVKCEEGRRTRRSDYRERDSNSCFMSPKRKSDLLTRALEKSGACARM